MNKTIWQVFREAYVNDKLRAPSPYATGDFDDYDHLSVGEKSAIEEGIRVSLLHALDMLHKASVSPDAAAIRLRRGETLEQICELKEEDPYAHLTALSKLYNTPACPHVEKGKPNIACELCRGYDPPDRPGDADDYT